MVIRGIGNAFLFAADPADGKSFLETKDIHYLVVVAVIY